MHNPTDATAWSNWGDVVRTEVGRKHEAIEAFQKAILLDPHDKNSSHMLAALNGSTLERASPGYIAAEFDGFGTFGVKIVRNFIAVCEWGTA